jgi:hypothetical protein
MLLLHITGRWGDPTIVLFQFPSLLEKHLRLELRVGGNPLDQLQEDERGPCALCLVTHKKDFRIHDEFCGLVSSASGSDP